MAKKKRPSIERFREFVKQHPQLRNEVKQKQITWQGLFEEWYILGEDHPRWNMEQAEDVEINETVSGTEVMKQEQQQELKENQEWISMLLSTLKNMDMNQIQQYIQHANQAIGTIQGVLEMFQGTNRAEQQESPKPEIKERQNPFTFRKD